MLIPVCDVTLHLTIISCVGEIIEKKKNQPFTDLQRKPLIHPSKSLSPFFQVPLVTVARRPSSRLHICLQSRDAARAAVRLTAAAEKTVCWSFKGCSTIKIRRGSAGRRLAAGGPNAVSAAPIPASCSSLPPPPRSLSPPSVSPSPYIRVTACECVSADLHVCGNLQI